MKSRNNFITNVKMRPCDLDQQKYYAADIVRFKSHTPNVDKNVSFS